LGAYRFKIDPGTFFQTNTRQAETLYQTVFEAIDFKPGQTIYDLYCGVGTLSLYVSEKAEKVIGIELNPSAIEKAKENAALNQVDHVLFEQGDMKDIFNDDLLERYGNPDVVITDPPRAGMHEDVVRQLKKVQPETIVYVSCNSATQARDIALMSDMYAIRSIRPVDMFPRTYHIESVAVLQKK
ncbi:methyltransferase domain-containing protein, partial [Balneolaceae bacterium ANBcel3]|nr:methyltransferase domain-containing protein [Balneolaceae bacterium ANBcel3]